MHSPARVVARIALVVIGGYAVTSGIVALLSVALPAFAGMVRSEAVVLSSMLSVIIYLVVLLWGFSCRKLLRLSFYFVSIVLTCAAFVVAIGRLGPT